MNKPRSSAEEEIAFGNDISLGIEKDPAVFELCGYAKNALEVMESCFGDNIIDIDQENLGMSEKYDYDLTKMGMCIEKLLDILRKKPQNSDAFDFGVAGLEFKRGKHLNSAYRTGIALQENITAALRRNPDIDDAFSDALERMSPWLAVKRFYCCIVRNMLIGWSEKKISDFSENERTIILGSPEVAYDYLKKNLTYNHRREYFDFKKLKDNEVLHTRLYTFVFWIDDYFTMRDPGEKGYRECSKESLGKLSRTLTEKIEQIGESFFDAETQQKDRLKLDYLKRRRKYAELVQFQGELSKRYFLNEYMEEGIITKNYFDYLSNTKTSWEALKELFYPARIRKKAKDLLKESKGPKQLTDEIRSTIEKILEYPPRQGYRLIRNLEMTVWSVNSVLRNQDHIGKGIGILGLENLRFDIAEEGEDVKISDGKL